MQQPQTNMMGGMQNGMMQNNMMGGGGMMANTNMMQQPNMQVCFSRGIKKVSLHVCFDF